MIVNTGLVCEVLIGICAPVHCEREKGPASHQSTLNIGFETQSVEQRGRKRPTKYAKNSMLEFVNAEKLGQMLTHVCCISLTDQVFPLCSVNVFTKRGA